MNAENKTKKLSHKKRATTRKNIHKMFNNLSGYNVSKEGIDSKYCLTYGEVTVEGVEKLVDILTELRNITSYPVERRTFYDLGSGIGKNVIMVAHLVPQIISKGLEIVPDRHKQALIAYNKIKDANIKNRIEFTCGSLFDKNLSDAAWVFISNLCFSEKLNTDLTIKLQNELQTNALIVCSKELPFQPMFRKLNKFQVPMTWNNLSEVFVYEKIE